MSGLGVGLPARTRNRKRRTDDSGFTDNADAPDISAGHSGRRSGNGPGPSRLTQQRATEAAAEARMEIEEQAEGGDDNGGPPRNANPSDHAAKVRRQQEKWQDSQSFLRSRMMDTFPCNIIRAKAQASALQEALQGEISSPTFNCPNCPMPQPLHNKEADGVVDYIGLDCCFQLTMYKHTCACCGHKFEPHALDFGCFISTPVTTHTWYDLRVLYLYKKLGPMEVGLVDDRCVLGCIILSSLIITFLRLLCSLSWWP